MKKIVTICEVVGGGEYSALDLFDRKIKCRSNAVYSIGDRVMVVNEQIQGRVPLRPVKTYNV